MELNGLWRKTPFAKTIYSDIDHKTRKFTMIEIQVFAADVLGTGEISIIYDRRLLAKEWLDLCHFAT